MAFATMASSSSPRARLDNATLYRSRSSSQSLSSGFASSTAFLSRSSSTSRVSNYRSSSMSVTKQRNGGVGGNGKSTVPVPNKKKTCMCSPTSHPGSFRCSLHKNSSRGGLQQQTPSSHSNNSGLNLIKLAMANSMIKIGIEEGNMMKKNSLSALIRQSSHHQQRRAAFQPRRSRLSVMSKAEGS